MILKVSLLYIIMYLKKYYMQREVKIMKCPYCNSDMNKGVIVGDRIGLDFIPDNAQRKFLVFPERIKLKGFLDENLTAYYCSNCYKIIININKDEDVTKENQVL